MESWTKQNKILHKMADDQNSMKTTLDHVVSSARGLGTLAVEYVAQKTGLERPLDIKQSLIKKAILDGIIKQDPDHISFTVASFGLSRIRKKVSWTSF